jgi:DNA/RNA endonuclease YhcR with UshA esterase domain
MTLSLGQGTANKLPSYDVKSEVVVKGKVTAVAAIPDWMGRTGVNVTLQTPDSVTVHVDAAPAEFLTMLDFAIASGDELEVTGVWSQWDGNRVFLARIVTRQKVAILLRDPEGRPVW